MRPCRQAAQAPARPSLGMHADGVPALFASFWMGGFEGADHVNSHGTPLHMNASNGHASQFGQDYAALAHMGLRTVRESIGWRAGTSPGGRLDVARLHALADAAQQHGLQVIWTLHHYGLPPGVDFFAADFAARFADFCDQVARALHGRSNGPPLFQPINEISFLSWAVGSTHLVHPHRDACEQRGYDLKCLLVEAALRGCDALWATEPRARMVHTDPLIHVAADVGAASPEQAQQWADEAHALTQAQFEAWDMLSGRREPALGGAPRYLDVLGVNYYHGNQWLHPSNMRLNWHTGDTRRRSLEDLLQHAWDRYARPVFLAETGHVGAGRARWLDDVALGVQRAIARGTPVQGICLYPVLDRPDWEDPGHWHHSGLWDVGASHRACAGAPAAARQALGRSLHLPLAQQLERWQRVLPAALPSSCYSSCAPAPPSAAPPAYALLHGSIFASRKDAPMYATPPTPAADFTAAANRHTSADTLVVFSHLRWDFVYQRPQQLLSRLARRMPVLFVEEPVPGAACATLEVMDPEPGVRVLRAHVTSEGAGFHDAHMAQVQVLLQAYLQQHAIARYWLWFYTPMALPLAARLHPQGIVYDCMDELAAFKFAPPELLQREDALFSQADLVFTGGFSLYEAKRARHPAVHCFPSSVDAAHFARARQPGGTDHVAQAQLPGPRLGYFGVIDERLDLELVAQLADARPDWQVVMVGPVVKIDPTSLPQRANLHWLGQRAYAELPEFLGGWDVCLMPFALNESTRFISPTKTLEYLAAGRPVVSTPIRDVVGPYTGVVAIAATPAAFITACEAALQRSAQEQARSHAAAQALLARTSWDGTAQAMFALMQGVQPTAPQERLRVEQRAAPQLRSATTALDAGRLVAR